MNNEQADAGKDWSVEKIRAAASRVASSMTETTPEQRQRYERLAAEMLSQQSELRKELKTLQLPSDDLWKVVERAEAAGLCIDHLTYGEVHKIITKREWDKFGERYDAKHHSGNAQPKRKPAKRRGRRSDPKADQAIADEYEEGLKSGRWDTITGFAKHKKKGRSTISKALDRAAKRE